MIAGDELVRGLNCRHRGLDETTDVLSFSFEHHGQYYGEGRPLGFKENNELFILPPDEPYMIGEVVISYHQATRQAEEANRQIDDEISALLIHGLLHLMGYDHETSAEEKRMGEIAIEASAALKSAGYLPIGELG
jgi:probable rRNA maturation factor